MSQKEFQRLKVIENAGELEPGSSSSLESLRHAIRTAGDQRLDRGVLSLHGPLTMENVSPFMNAVRRETPPP